MIRLLRQVYNKSFHKIVKDWFSHMNIELWFQRSVFSARKRRYIMYKYFIVVEHKVELLFWVHLVHTERYLKKTVKIVVAYNGVFFVLFKNWRSKANPNLKTFLIAKVFFKVGWTAVCSMTLTFHPVTELILLLMS